MGIWPGYNGPTVRGRWAHARGSWDSEGGGWIGCTVERDRMAQGEPNQLYWVGFFLFGPFPEENMFGFS